MFTSYGRRGACPPQDPDGQVLARVPAEHGPAMRRALAERLDRSFPGRVDVALVGAEAWAGRYGWSFMILPMAGLAAVTLAGVLWMEVLRRTSELGLRRAVGATARAVRGQLLFEVAVLATKAAIAAAIVLAHLVFFGFGLVTEAPFLAEPLHQVARYLVMFPLSLTGFLTLVLAAAWLPSRLALRVAPLEALRDE
jgi:hypothetical protein